FARRAPNLSTRDSEISACLFLRLELARVNEFGEPIAKQTKVLDLFGGFDCECKVRSESLDLGSSSVVRRSERELRLDIFEQERHLFLAGVVRVIGQELVARSIDPRLGPFGHHL